MVELKWISSEGVIQNLKTVLLIYFTRVYYWELSQLF